MVMPEKLLQLLPRVLRDVSDVDQPSVVLGVCTLGLGLAFSLALGLASLSALAFALGSIFFVLLKEHSRR